MAKGGIDGCGMNFIKYTLFFFNFLFWLAGCALLGAGIYALVELGDFDVILSSAAGLPIATLVLGIVIFIIGFLGCCGAIKESTGMLYAYFFIVLLIFIGEVVVAILAFTKTDTVESWVTDGLNKGIENYKPKGDPTYDPNYNTAIDKIQKKFSCCGSTSIDTWSASPYVNATAGALPESCNAALKGTDKQAATALCLTGPTAQSEGCKALPATDDNTVCCACYIELKDWVNRNIYLVAGLTIGFAVCQVFSLIFSCCLIRAIKESPEYA